MTTRRGAADWTPDRVRRFWDHLAASPQIQELYFSNMVGAGIVAFMRRAGFLRGRVLDYGCGPGYLLQHVLASGAVRECWGTDHSEHAVAKCNARFAGDVRWRGARRVEALPVDLPDEAFDAAFCVETLEHLQDDDLRAVLDELRRLLAPSGALMVTVPFAEDLSASMVYCPFCDSEFHGVQHVRSFDVASLRAAVVERGFDVVYCGNVDLRNFQRPFPRRLGGLRGGLTSARDLSAIALDRARPKPFPDSAVFKRVATPGPHLCAIATRRA